MDDWLGELGADARVLDIGSAGGSFSTGGLQCSVICVDEDCGAFELRDCGRQRVVGRAERLPIASRTIDLVVCNHALEHFADPAACLDEARRVLKSGGRLFVSVPGGYGICDGVYRWLFAGGGTSIASGDRT